MTDMRSQKDVHESQIKTMVRSCMTYMRSQKDVHEVR